MSHLAIKSKIIRISEMTSSKYQIPVGEPSIPTKKKAVKKL
jgi:hypothetical protein